MQILVTLLIWWLAHRELHIFLVLAAAIWPLESFDFFDIYSHTSYRPQSFEVVLETWSSDLRLPSLNCPTCTPGCAIFDTSTSSAFIGTPTSSSSDAEITIAYGFGEVRGILGSDTVAMGGFAAPSQTFCDYPLILVFSPFINIISSDCWRNNNWSREQPGVGSDGLGLRIPCKLLACDLNPVSETPLAPGGVFLTIRSIQ